MKKITSLVLCFVLLFSFISFAENDITGENSDVYITVKGTSGNINSSASIVVLKPGYEKADLEAELDSATDNVNSLDALMWFDEGVTDENGEFKFLICFPDEAAADDYKIYVTVSGETAESFEGVLRYISDGNKLTATEAFNTAAGAGGSLSILNDAVSAYSFTLSLFEENERFKALYDELCANERLYLLFKTYGAYSTEAAELNNSMALIKKNLEKSVKLLKADLITDINELKEFIGNEKNVLGLDISAINDENSDFVYESILDMTEISDASEIQSTIDNSVILWSVKNAITWGAVQSVLVNYKNELSIDTENPGVDYTAVYQAIYNMRNSFNDVGDITSSFTALSAANPKVSVSVGGGGGGGGGSYTPPEKEDDGVISKPVITVPEEEEKEEIIMDFSDVERNFWGYNAIKSLYEKNIMKGKEEGLFGTNSLIKREEIAAVLVRAFDMQLKNDVTIFSDVSSEAWYATEVANASSNGIIKGYPDGSFGVNKNVTRQDLCVMLFNLLKEKNIDIASDEEKSFTDKENISDYAREAVFTLSGAGIINGYDDGSFRPRGNATRAEAASLINGLLERIN